MTAYYYDPRAGTLETEARDSADLRVMFEGRQWNYVVERNGMALYHPDISGGALVVKEPYPIAPSDGTVGDVEAFLDFIKDGLVVH